MFRLRDGFEQQDGAKAIHILTVPLKKRRNVSGIGKDPGLGMYQEFAVEGRAERAWKCNVVQGSPFSSVDEQ